MVPSDTDVVPAEKVIGWWAGEDVQPWVVLDGDARLTAYGELWVDDKEDEIELARLIVAPDLRGRGLGKRLVGALVERAWQTGLSEVFLRVRPDNAVAIGCYLASGFLLVDPVRTAEFNEGQPVRYVWMEHLR